MCKRDRISPGNAPITNATVREACPLLVESPLQKVTESKFVGDRRAPFNV